MVYRERFPLRRPPRLKRRPAGQPPDHDLAVVVEVVAEFPRYGVDEVLAEARRRGVDVTSEFVRVVVETYRG